VRATAELPRLPVVCVGDRIGIRFAVQKHACIDDPAMAARIAAGARSA
jgi:hypothetical protein